MQRPILVLEIWIASLGSIGLSEVNQLLGMASICLSMYFTITQIKKNKKQ